jgi:hypothetical protein
MASTYTTSLALQLMATGENAGTWGQITNTNLVLIQQAIAGYQAISIAGGAQTTALVMTQNQLANARNIVIKLTGTITGNQIVTVPNNITKTWIVSNGTVGNFTVTFKYAGTGSGQTWSTTDKGIKILYADGSDIQVVDLSTLSGQVVSTQIADFAVNTAELATNAVTAIKITQSTITQAKLASNSVGATQIPQSTITQSKLAADSVGSNQLISTGIVAASYSKINITVDSDGRITSIASGSAVGAGMEIPTRYTQGPASGTHTASPTANRLGVYMIAGGGGGATGGCSMCVTFYAGGPGGPGGFGFCNAPIAQPFSQPFSIGGGGGGSYNGGAGGTTNLATVGSVNGGNGGTTAMGGSLPGAAGNPGTAPGASLTYPVRQFGFGANTSFGNGGPGGVYGATPGNAGAMVIFENTGI